MRKRVMLGVVVVLALAGGVWAQAPTGRIESPESGTLTVPASLVKWDQAAADLAAVRALRFTTVIGGVRSEVAGVVCGPPTGATPPTLFSCTAPWRPEWVNGVTLTLIAWLPAPTIAQPSALRVLPGSTVPGEPR